MKSQTLFLQQFYDINGLTLIKTTLVPAVWKKIGFQIYYADFSVKPQSTVMKYVILKWKINRFNT